MQSGPLADLERRWGDEHSPQLTLQLAEEHRRQGNLSRALEVLRQGLDHHPKHVAARVALGRFLFEDGQASASVSVLESVVDEDPAHLVANKLLVGACLAAGDRDRAVNRLGLYTLLNPSDPDIEDLEQQVEETESGAAPEARTTEEPAEMPQPEVTRESRPATSSDPFGDLGRAPDPSSYRSALAAEGIFLVADLAPEPEPEESVAEPEEEVAEPEDIELEPAEATVTLGRLYLEQGHVEEAEHIFRAVLENEPDNADAEAGLRQAQGVGAELMAADLVSPEVLSGSDPEERKRQVLEGYRSRLRTGSAEG